MAVSVDPSAASPAYVRIGRALVTKKSRAHSRTYVRSPSTVVKRPANRRQNVAKGFVTRADEPHGHLQALQMPLCDLEKHSPSGRDATTAGMHGIEGPWRWRVRIEHLHESIGGNLFVDGGSCQAGDAESSHRGVHHERDAVHDEASTHGDLDRPAARMERPASPWRVRCEDDAVVPHQVAWRTRRSTVAQVFARRKATQLSAPQFVRHEGGVFHRARAEREVELFLHELHLRVREHQLDAHLGMPRETLRDDITENPLAQRDRSRHAQSTGRLFGAGRECAPRFLDRRERWTASAEVRLACARELHAARRALEQTGAERALELADPAAHRRARHPQGIRSSPKAPELRYASEELDGAHLDCPLHGTHSSTRTRLATRHPMEYVRRRERSSCPKRCSSIRTAASTSWWCATCRAPFRELVRSWSRSGQRESIRVRR